MTSVTAVGCESFGCWLSIKDATTGTELRTGFSKKFPTIFEIA